jgi:hypothetical protein
MLTLFLIIYSRAGRRSNRMTHEYRIGISKPLRRCAQCDSIRAKHLIYLRKPALSPPHQSCNTSFWLEVQKQHVSGHKHKLGIDVILTCCSDGHKALARNSFSKGIVCVYVGTIGNSQNQNLRIDLYYSDRL